MTQQEWPQSEPAGLVGPDGQLAVPGRLPDRGFGTGAVLRLHLRPSQGLPLRPVFTIDGRTELTDWTTLEIAVAPGHHRIGAGVSSDVRYNAMLEANLAPGQVLDVFYATGPLEGRIGLAPVQPRTVQPIGVFFLVLFTLVVLGFFALLVLGLMLG